MLEFQGKRMHSVKFHHTCKIIEVDTAECEAYLCVDHPSGQAQEQPVQTSCKQR